MENIVQGQWFRGPSADLGEPIDQSLRFSSSGYLTRAQLTTGDGKLNDSGRTFTFSTWFKHGDMGETQIFGIHQSTSDNWLLGWTTSQLGFAARDVGTGYQSYNSTRVYRDPSAWYHLFLTCSSGVLTLYVNGVQGDQTDTQNHSMDRDFVLGAENTGGSTPMDAYLAETYFIQGTVLHPVNDGFIRLNEDGIYVPDTPTISSYGTNGWHLTYDSSQTNGIGHDSSGNDNHFTATGFNTTAISSANRLNDIDIKDTPTSNYAVFNPLWHQLTPSLKGANMVLNTANTITGQATFRFPVGTTGKYWVEAGTANLGNTTNSPALCLTSELNAAGLTASAHLSTVNYSTVSGWGPAYSNFNSTSSTAYTEVGGRVGMAIDFDNQEVKHYNNSTLLNTDTTVDFTKELALVVMQPSTSYNTYEPYLNAGQQAFIQTVPTGFNELQTNNLPEPTIKNGKEYFDVVTYTGNASTNAITSLEFQPDFVWIKSRSHSSSHGLYDSIRGVNKELRSDVTNSEFTFTDSLNSFDSNGFTLGTDTGNGDVNLSGRTYVAWCWKAGTSYTPTVTGFTSPSASINTEAGFGIYTFTGNNVASSFTHGLDSTPELIIARNRTTASDWAVFGPTGSSSTPTATDTYLRLNETTDANKNGTQILTGNTSTTVSVASFGNTAASDDYVYYLWHSVEGFSKIGRYTGNGNSDGPFIYTGFKPAFILFKAPNATSDWFIYDAGRFPNNSVTQILRANSSGGESGTGNDIDFLSNGFKIRNTGSSVNTNGTAYLYMAFAEHPFGGENAPPATAR